MPTPLGAKVRALRIQHKLSLEKLAELTQSSKSYLWNLEHQESIKPSADKVEKIATALHVTPDFLLDKSDATPDQDVLDAAFFRKFRSLPEADKRKFRRIIDVWTEDNTGRVQS
ncbi:helix-turn-helix transcriptional regulator [Hahella aquimaris]|uniref:helix-turn-helix domain-containing protein n=1 Tax=Hahella sp. HNIBRBA332 TaxID=3015983 RepID=UPI00273B9892|nr:helix-turn-helix transcriptional regulator [Hahella sp. HNIBRBA332]WLQ14324.1 helix-turn-helix transcriptional regulator [Hahella sp. HNIBRBA332]